MIHNGTYLLHFMYVYLYMNNKPVRSKNLTSGQIFFEDLIWLVRGNNFSKEMFRHIINTIRGWEGTPHHSQESYPSKKGFNHTIDDPTKPRS